MNLDQPVPAIDLACVQAFVTVVQQGHHRQDVATAMLRWVVAILRLQIGHHDTAEHLRELRDELMAAHRAEGRAEEARRRGGQAHG